VQSRTAYCWGCKSFHKTGEAKPRTREHWLDLCEGCLVDYFQARSFGARLAKQGMAVETHHRENMTSVERSGYLAGQFLARVPKGKWKPVGGSATERLLVDG
jgi:hypothetical protein